MIKFKSLVGALTLLVVTTLTANAQSTVGGIFNPASQYGLGELTHLGTSASRGMGGIGLANRERFSMSLLNPASYNSSDRQNVLFSVSGEGVNNYLKTDNSKNSRNYFNLGHMGMQIRISKRMGFGLVIAPYSEMGYTMTKTVTQNDVITNIGNVMYQFDGGGSVAQFKTGLSYALVKGLNIGANYIYYVGALDESSTSTYTPYIEGTILKNNYRTFSRKVNQSSFEVGAQYTAKLEEGKWINLGAVYQPRTKSYTDNTYIVATGYSSSALTGDDVVTNDNYQELIYIPSKMAFGVNYVTNKLLVGLDYTFQDWGSSFPENSYEGIAYQNRNEIRLGGQYTPNRFDIRSPLKRWTYRAGMMYGNSYVIKDGIKTNEIAGSIGVGIPIEKDWFSQLSVAAEIGKSGTLTNGQIQNTYVKLSVGITFAATRWFVRIKYF